VIESDGLYVIGTLHECQTKQMPRS